MERAAAENEKARQHRDTIGALRARRNRAQERALASGITNAELEAIRLQYPGL